MTVNKRRKSSRMQGSNTHGWGPNQHRGSGSRGGVGRAGTGKKAHNKKTEIWKNPNYMGKSGFTRLRSNNKINAISIQHLQDKIPNLIKEKKASEKNGTVEINLSKIKYDKLLGTGKITQKLTIIGQATAKAKEKIEQAGGSVVQE
ncbi:50S ribosomal protein L15 [Candidatus Woesearchaeota archaeon CG10_big_fil_rev_8_21_14_0_10_37_12]|nr:MAG: 50S ribosomal protein L15 [Candidatus Woesearchaeota archaeon CG10_big_fil_rev_8_21_14_0_10_37_12]